MPAEDAHITCMRCLGLDHARWAVEDPLSCVSCEVLGERLCVARLERMKALTSQRPADDRLPPSGTVRRRQSSPPAALGAPPAKRRTEEELDHLERRAADLREAVSALEEEGDDSLSLHAPDDLDVGDSASVLLQRYERARSAAPSTAGSVAPSNAGSAASEGPPVVTEATCALLAKVAVSLGLKWEEPASDKLLIPTCPQFAVAFREYWTRMQGRFRPSRDTRPWTLIADQEPLGINRYPTMDDMVAAMILPDKEIIGKVPQLKPGPERLSDQLLSSTFSVLSSMARLTNAAMLLSSYLARLIPTLPGGSQDLVDEAMEVSRLLGLLQTDLARANGQAVASVVSSRRHLWLSQSKLPLPVQKTFMGLPLTPGATFGPGVDAILQQTAKLRKDRETLQQFMATSRPRPAHQTTWQPRYRLPPGLQQRLGPPPPPPSQPPRQRYGNQGNVNQQRRQRRGGPPPGRGRPAAKKGGPQQSS